MAGGRVRDTVLACVPVVRVWLRVVLRGCSSGVLCGPEPQIEVVVGLPNPLVGVTLLAFGMFDVGLGCVGCGAMCAFISFSGCIFGFVFQ